MADKSQWFRVSTRINDSKKIHDLSDSHFRWVIMFWAEARKNDGILPPIHVMEFNMRRPAARIKRAIAELRSKRFIDEIDGHLVPHDWDEHQWEETSSTERVKRHRERKRNATETLHETQMERDETALREEHSRVTEQIREEPPFPPAAETAVATSPVTPILDECERLYAMAGKPLPEKHRNLAVQLLMGIKTDKLPRLPNYIKWALASGTWSDPAHTKSLLNLIRDGDWDVELTHRTLPTVARDKSRGQSAQDEATRSFLAKRGAL